LVGAERPLAGGSDVDDVDAAADDGENYAVGSATTCFEEQLPDVATMFCRFRRQRVLKGITAQLASHRVPTLAPRGGSLWRALA
jgi:hypothetical protein